MKLKFEDFERMEEIDHQYFPNENISPAKEAYKWYLADPNSCVVVKEKNDVVAYINILSLKEKVYNKVKNNLMNESEIVVDDLELKKDKYFNYLYFSVIAIDKNNRNIKTLKRLVDITKDHLKSILKETKIIEVMADCSTKEGEKISRKILKLRPFMKTSHDSTIYVTDGESFVNDVLLGE